MFIVNSKNNELFNDYYKLNSNNHIYIGIIIFFIYIIVYLSIYWNKLNINNTYKKNKYKNDDYYFSIKTIN
jgi:hypothetical protein